MTFKVEKIKLSDLPAAEAAAIREAEAKAEAFYQRIDDEENENARILELRAVCALIIKNKERSASYVTAHLAEDTLFTDEEKATLILAAKNYNNEDLVTALRTFDLTRSANRLYRIVKAGGYPVETAAELMSKIKPAPKKFLGLF